MLKGPRASRNTPSDTTTARRARGERALDHTQPARGRYYAGRLRAESSGAEESAGALRLINYPCRSFAFAIRRVTCARHITCRKRRRGSRAICTSRRPHRVGASASRGARESNGSPRLPISPPPSSLPPYPALGSSNERLSHFRAWDVPSIDLKLHGKDFPAQGMRGRTHGAFANLPCRQ